MRKKAAAALTAAVMLPLAQIQSVDAASLAAPKGVVIASTASTGSPVTLLSSARSWRGLGGKFSSRPAVAFSNGKTHYFASNSRGQLLHRTLATGWHTLTRTPCSAPSAAAYNGTVRVVCVGSKRAAMTMAFAGSAANPYQATLTSLGGSFTSLSVMVDAAGYSVFGVGARYRSKSGNRVWTSNTYVKYPGSAWRHWDTYATGQITVASSTRRVFLAYPVGSQILVEVFDWTLPRSSPNFYKYWFAKARPNGSFGISATGDGSTGVLVVADTAGRAQYRAITKNGMSGSWMGLPGRLKNGVTTAPTGTFRPLPVPTTPAPPTATPTPSESTPSRPPTEPVPPAPAVTTTVTVTQTAPPSSSSTSSRPTRTRTTTAPPPPSSSSSSSAPPPPSSTSTPPPSSSTAAPPPPPSSTAAPTSSTSSSAPAPSTSPTSSSPSVSSTSVSTPVATTSVPAPPSAAPDPTSTATNTAPGVLASLAVMGAELGLASAYLGWMTVEGPQRAGLDGFVDSHGQP